MIQQSWEFSNPVKVIFDIGAVSRLSEHLNHQRIVLVTSSGFSKRGVVGRIAQSLGERLIAVLDDVRPNPDVRDIDVQLEKVRALQPDCIVGLGGGSSIDTVKALSRFLTQPKGATLVAHFREGQPLAETPALPMVAIPTTAGTGAEVTPFGTVWDFERNKKYSVTGSDLYPATAILDPELTMALPADVTISSGLDAVSHALESTWNKRANPITLALAAKSLQLSLPALRKLRADLLDANARGAMMQASLLAGLAISQTRTALAHSISYPLTTHFDLPHGIACSFTLPALLRFNAEEDDGRLHELARGLGYGSVGELADELDSLLRLLDVKEAFSRHVAEPGQVMGLIEEMFTPGRADNNIRSAKIADVEFLVKASMDYF